MNHLCRVTIWSMTLLSLLGSPAQSRSATPSPSRSQALVELEVPADIAPTVYYTEGLQVRHDNFNRTRVRGNVQLRFQEKNDRNSPVWLRSPQSRVLVSPAEEQPGRPTRVQVAPLSDAGAEMEVPTGVKARLEGAALFFETANDTLWVAGPAALRLSNGVRLLVRNTRLTLIQRQPSGDRRVIIESFTPSPQ